MQGENLCISIPVREFKKRREYMNKRTLLITMAVCGLILSGCGKKPKQAQVQNVPQIPEAPAVAAPAKTDTGDVFKEFSKKGSKEAEGKGNKKAIAPESYTPEFSENGRYVVQIAAASARTAADELAAAFKGKGYPAYVVEVQNPTPALQGTYYRVRIGGFTMLADAKAFGENILRLANYDYWVDLKSNEGMTYGSPVNQSTSTPYSTPAPTPSSSYEPASTPVYTPTPTPSTSTTPSTETNWNAGSSTPAATSPGTAGSSLTTPAPAAGTTPEPAATTPATSTGSSWTTGSSSAPATATETPATTTPPAQSTESTQPAATTPPASSTDTSKGSWGGGWK
jgi:hypothetical protein